MKKVIPVLIIYFYVSAICCVAQDTPSIGSDKVIKKTALSSFETVAIKGGGDFYFHYSPTTKIQIKGTSSCVEQMEVTVLSNTLRISPKEGFLENCIIEIHIFTPLIIEIQQDGGGRIAIDEGFTPIDVFKCSINGGGSMEMTALKVDSLMASINGGGKISAQVTEYIQGKIRGGGLISYQGEPSIISDILGGGAIKRK